MYGYECSVVKDLRTVVIPVRDIQGKKIGDFIIIASDKKEATRKAVTYLEQRLPTIRELLRDDIVLFVARTYRCVPKDNSVILVKIDV